MIHRIETPDTPENRDELHAIIHEFYSLQAGKLFASGGPQISPDVPVNAFWEDAGNYFPPRGAMVLARAEAGHLVGCGGMSDIGDGIAELKYLYVKPEARGTGLGRWLVEERIAIARRMGLTRICVDTLKMSYEMHALYEKLGFERVDDFPQSKSLRDVTELAPFLTFYQRPV